VPGAIEVKKPGKGIALKKESARSPGSSACAASVFKNSSAGPIFPRNT
jgi:hypothetical protein